MKTKLFIGAIILIGLFAISSTSCESKGNNTEAEASQTPSTAATPELDTALDKYAGLYVFMKSKYSVGKFPNNSRVHTETGDKYPALSPKFIGKYFLAKDGLSYETTKVQSYAGGFVAPPIGNIILGVDKASGEINIQNYNNYGKSGDIIEFGLGGTGTYGKFILRDDGKYDLQVDGARHVWTKGI
jgi:hypothetical protein